MYAPTLDADDDVEDASNYYLQANVDEALNGDITVVPSDWNARTDMGMTAHALHPIDSMSPKRTTAGVKFRMALRNRIEVQSNIANMNLKTNWAPLKAAARKPLLKHLGHTQRR